MRVRTKIDTRWADGVKPVGSEARLASPEETATYFAQALEHDMVFVFFDGEERGRWVGVNEIEDIA